MPKDFFIQKNLRSSMSDIILLKKSAAISEETKEKKKKKRPRWLLVLILLIAILGGISYAALRVLPRVEIKIFLQKYPLAFNQAVEASISEGIKLPAELFTEKRNLQMSFPASGKQNVQKKAQGKIIIYNSYSSEVQNLVAGTRFLTPDNKIFRLTKNITVPGAKIQEGKIVNSSIEVDVIADQPGVEYNIGPMAKLTIPGLKGSPKYEGFYGQSTNPMTGGFVGEAAIPTDKDIADAKVKIRQVLEDNLKIVIFSQLHKDFKVIDGSSKFEILNEKINKEVDKDNNFSVVSEAQMKLLAFQEKDLKDILFNQLKPQLVAGDYEVIDFQIEYGVSRSNFEKGVMSFPVKGQIIFQNKTDPEFLRQQAKGKNEQELKLLVFALPGLEKAQFSFWPIYVKSAPPNINKIKVVIQ